MNDGKVVASELARRIRRSVLVVPGHSARMHVKAFEANADEVVFDLEDSVAPEARPVARETVLRTLAAEGWAGRATAIRVNPPRTEAFERDIELWDVLDVPRPAVVVPKVETPEDIRGLGRALGVEIQALIETPAGLANTSAVAAENGVVALILGYADLATALGRRGAEEWLVQQEAILAGARIGGAQAIDGPFFGLTDHFGLLAAARRTRELGFDGKWSIHPSQVRAINEIFAATPAEHAWALEVRDVVAAAHQAGGAVARLRNRMVDEAMVRQADRTLALPLNAPELGETPRTTGQRTEQPPYYEDLAVGARFDAPGLTITEGHAVAHQAIVGDRLRLSLDSELYAAVAGRPGQLAHPVLVCDIAIGQSTGPSGRVLGNLFYCGLQCRPVEIGTTLRTRTHVVARRATSGGRGIVALEVSSEDANGSPILNFWRCPLLPRRSDAPADGNDDLSLVGSPVDPRSLVPDWDLSPLRDRPLGALFADLQVGDRIEIEAGETVTSAPELARLSLNLAMAHTDGLAGPHGRRLVYGGHVIGIAAAQVTRALPDVATILSWTSCDHIAPTFEGDRLTTNVEIVSLEQLDDGGLVTLRARTSVDTDGGVEDRCVLDWVLTALMP
jgi:citrate lyase beta subunit/acyl dehydratase